MRRIRKNSIFFLVRLISVTFGDILIYAMVVGRNAA